MTKTIFLAWACLCLTATTMAQFQVNKLNPFTSQADQVYSDLDKNVIGTDILYDRVFPYANLREFNQTSADTSKTIHYYIAYAELQQADYSNRWTTVNALKNNIKALPDNQIPVGFINVDFNYIDEAAIQNNQLSYNTFTEKLQDVPGRNPHPYLTERAFVVSTLRDYTCGLTISIVTNDAYNMTAASKNIQTIQADFGSGYVTLPNNSSVQVTFSSTGLKTIKYKITYTDSSVQYTYSTLKVNDKNPMLTRVAAQTVDPGCTPVNQNIQFDSEYSFQGYNESAAFTGMGEYRIYRGGSAVDNPVILVDGFDPFEGTPDGNDITGIYNDFDNDESGFIGTQLQSDDFDIIPLNFLRFTDGGKEINGGTDYIERNAMTLVTLIEAINECKVGNNPIKVVGFSMGGLVARYALAYMEANNIPHEADLFVSIDSPHQGAVVPIGIQESAKLINDIISDGTAEGLGTDLLDTPAAKQLLVHHYLANSKTPAGAPGFHDRFFNDLNSMGFPENTRNISIVNGVQTGLNINPVGGRYVDLIAQTGLIFPLGARIKAKLDYTPDRGLTRNAFDFVSQLKFLGVYITIFERIQQATTIYGRGSYENTPGGFYEVNSLVSVFVGDINQIFDNWLLNLFVGDINVELNNPDFSFIPVKSSLAFDGSVDLYEDFSTRNLVCTGETPFDSYFTAVNDNENHIELTNVSAIFIREEILGNEQLPNAPFTSAAIQGPAIVCANNVVTYELDQCVGRDSDMWTVSSNLTIETSDMTSITVSVNNANGAAFVKAEVAGQIVTKNIWLGNAGAPTILNGPIEVDTGGEYTYTGGGAPGATHYKWILPYPFDPVTDVRIPFDYNGDNWQMYPEGDNPIQETITVFSGNGGHNGLVQIVARNQCNGPTGGSSMHLEVEHTNTGGCTHCNNPLTVLPVPNPADDYFQLDFTTHAPGDYDIYLYDAYSFIYYNARVSNELVTVDTSNLPNGTYFLHIYFPDFITQQQVMVQH